MTDARDIVEPEAFSRAIVHLQKELQQSLDESASLRKQLEDARSLPTDDGWEDIENIKGDCIHDKAR